MKGWGKTPPSHDGEKYTHTTIVGQVFKANMQQNTNALKVGLAIHHPFLFSTTTILNLIGAELKYGLAFHKFINNFMSLIINNNNT